MSAIGGLIDRGSGADLTRLARGLVDRQRPYGRDDQATARIAGAVFGRALHRTTDHDRHDRGPRVDEGSATMLVADVRLDDRDGLRRQLGIDWAAARAMADSDLLFAAWQRWRDDVFDHLAGCYAFALWDARERRLTLARDPFGQRPLHFARGRGWLAFASMPQALRALPGIDGAPDLDRLAAFVADLPREGPASFFRGIERVEPGEVVIVSPTGITRRRHWSGDACGQAVPNGELVEAYRFHLDQAIEGSLRGAGTLVAAHLSGGWDSAAVASSAALALAPSGRVAGFTAAPPLGFRGDAGRRLVVDESALAARVAAAHRNLDHHVVRDRDDRPLALLADNDRWIGEPTGHVCNNQWWTAINRRAAEMGARVLLTGEMGNHVISAGGALQLADLVRQGQFGRWLAESRALVARGVMRWPGVLDNGLGPFVPGYAALRPRLRGGEGLDPAALLEPGLRARVTAARGARRWQRPPADSRRHRIAMLGGQDSGAFRSAARARWDLDERDPTVDRRLVEFCLSLPIEALLKDGIPRPLARAALADRLPAELLDERARGLQFADWHQQVAPAEVAALALDGTADQLIDRTAVAALLARWPARPGDDWATVSTYRMTALRLASACSFLRTYSGAPSVAPPLSSGDQDRSEVANPGHLPTGQ